MTAPFRLTDAWKDEIEGVSKDVLDHLAKVVCLQTQCGDRGFDSLNCGCCAFCADTAESVIGEYLRLVKLEIPRGQ